MTIYGKKHIVIFGGSYRTTAGVTTFLTDMFSYNL